MNPFPTMTPEDLELIEKLVSDRKAFNEFVYTPVENTPRHLSTSQNRKLFFCCAIINPMFGLTEIFGILAGIFSFSAYIFYIFAIVRGTTKPQRATWIIWAVIGLILAFSYKSSGAEDTIWVPMSEGIAPTIIAILSLKYGVGGKDKMDIFCFAASLFSLVLWWLFDSPEIALVTNLAIDFFAALPTIKKTWRKPGEEDRFAWTLTQIGNSFNLFAIDKFTFVIMVYPIYTFFIDGVVTGLLYKKIRSRKFSMWRQKN